MGNVCVKDEQSPFCSTAGHLFVPTDLPGVIGAGEVGYGRFVAGGRRSLPLGPVPDQAAGFITAPSMTTPWVTYFHKATRSLRASATIARLRPCWLRSLNQRVRADCGW